MFVKLSPQKVECKVFYSHFEAFWLVMVIKIGGTKLNCYVSENRKCMVAKG